MAIARTELARTNAFVSGILHFVQKREHCFEVWSRRYGHPSKRERHCCVGRGLTDAERCEMHARLFKTVARDTLREQPRAAWREEHRRVEHAGPERIGGLSWQTFW